MPDTGHPMMHGGRCQVCEIGILRPGQRTYAYRAGKYLVALPGVAVWICDACGQILYDPEITLRIHMLLGTPEPFSAADAGSGAAGDVPDPVVIPLVRRWMA